MGKSIGRAVSGFLLLSLSVSASAQTESRATRIDRQLDSVQAELDEFALLAGKIRQKEPPAPISCQGAAGDAVMAAYWDGLTGGSFYPENALERPTVDFLVCEGAAQRRIGACDALAKDVLRKECVRELFVALEGRAIIAGDAGETASLCRDKATFLKPEGCDVMAKDLSQGRSWVDTCMSLMKQGLFTNVKEASVEDCRRAELIEGRWSLARCGGLDSSVFVKSLPAARSLCSDLSAFRSARSGGSCGGRSVCEAMLTGNESSCENPKQRLKKAVCRFAEYPSTREKWIEYADNARWEKPAPFRKAVKDKAEKLFADYTAASQVVNGFEPKSDPGYPELREKLSGLTERVPKTIVRFYTNFDVGAGLPASAGKRPLVPEGKERQGE